MNNYFMIAVSFQLLEMRHAIYDIYFNVYKNKQRLNVTRSEERHRKSKIR